MVQTFVQVFLWTVMNFSTKSIHLLCCLVTRSCPALLRPHGLQLTRLPCPRDFPSQNTGVGYHFLLQGIFLTQGLNPCLLHWHADSLPLSHQGSPNPIHTHILLPKQIRVHSQVKSIYWHWAMVKQSAAFTVGNQARSPGS